MYTRLQSHDFKVVANVSAENHLKSVETLNGRLPKDVNHIYHPTPNWNKFSNKYATAECTVGNNALRMANALGGYDSLFGKPVIKTYEFFSRFVRRIVSPILGGN